MNFVLKFIELWPSEHSMIRRPDLSTLLCIILMPGAQQGDTRYMQRPSACSPAAPSLSMTANAWSRWRHKKGSCNSNWAMRGSCRTTPGLVWTAPFANMETFFVVWVRKRPHCNTLWCKPGFTCLVPYPVCAQNEYLLWPIGVKYSQEGLSLLLFL